MNGHTDSPHMCYTYRHHTHTHTHTHTHQTQLNESHPDTRRAKRSLLKTLTVNGIVAIELELTDAGAWSRLLLDANVLAIVAAKRVAEWPQSPATHSLGGAPAAAGVTVKFSASMTIIGASLKYGIS
jgi:hypothetical protein